MLEPVYTCGPCRKTAHGMTHQFATEVFMRRERRRLQARHIWEKIEPDWPMIKERVWTKQATGLSYDALFRRLFLHVQYTEESVGWRIPTRDRTGAGSNSSGSAARPGLQDKPLRGLQVNGSALDISIDLIRSTPWQGNGLISMRIW